MYDDLLMGVDRQSEVIGRPIVPSDCRLRIYATDGSEAARPAASDMQVALATLGSPEIRASVRRSDDSAVLSMPAGKRAQLAMFMEHAL